MEEILYMAKIAEQAERYEDMVDYMEKMTEAAEAERDDLTADERSLLSLAYKNVIGPRRAAWRIVSSIEQKEESRGNEHRVAAIKALRAKIESELTSICVGILNLLEPRLIPLALTNESKVFYRKLMGDYYRYLAEFKTGSDRKAAADKTLAAYQSAQDIAMEGLPPINTARLGLALNFSVFYFEILNSPDQACALAQQAFDEAMAELDTLDEQSDYKDSTLIMQLLQENLKLWTSNVQEDGVEEDNEVSNLEEEEE